MRPLARASAALCLAAVAASCGPPAEPDESIDSTDAADAVDAGANLTGNVSTFTDVPPPVVRMQIVAHEDDDFLFMNPDIEDAIAAGYDSVTVYLTAGETNGAGGVTCTSDLETSRSEFARQRQLGVLAAYAKMARDKVNTSCTDDCWTRELIVPDAGVAWPHVVERYTHKQLVRLRLIFMNLRENGEDPSGGPDPGSLFADPSLVTNTIVPSCAPKGSCGWVSCDPDMPWQNYTRSEVLTVLSRLIEMYQPHVVATLDPQPLQKIGPGGEYEISYDNLDHTAAARFVDEALASYHGPNQTDRFTVTHYKGYSAANYPLNLGTEDANDKRNAALAYLPFDDNYAAYADNYETWYRTMYERYPGGTSWVERASNGRLLAAGVQGRRVKIWYEKSAGGSWAGPVDTASDGPVSPAVTVVKRADGRLQLFAMRLPLALESHAPPAGAPRQDVITAIQKPNAMTFGAWQSIGSPDADQFNGAPSATVDGAGRIFVFARNSAGRVSYAAFSGGVWSPWAQLAAPPAPAASDIIEGVAAIARDDGRVEAFATSRTGHLIRYTQVAGSTAFVVDPTFSFSGAASSPTVAKNKDGRLELFWRERTDGGTQYGRVMTAWQNTSGAWTGGAPTVPGSVLYGDAGVGPVAAIRRGGSGHIMIFERNTWHGLSATWQATPNSSFVTQWQLFGGFAEEYPAAATDAAGRAVVLAKGGDGKMYMRRETSAGAFGSFGAWQAVGN